MSLLDQYQRERQRSRQRRQDNRGFQRDLQGGIQQLEAMRQQMNQEKMARDKAALDQRMRESQEARDQTRHNYDLDKLGREIDRLDWEKENLWDPERRLKTGQAVQQEKFAGAGDYAGRGEMDIRLGKGQFELENILPKRAEAMGLQNLTLEEQLDRIKQEAFTGDLRLQTGRQVQTMIDDYLRSGEELPAALPGEFIPGLRREADRLGLGADFQGEVLPEASKAWRAEVERRNALALKNEKTQADIDKKNRPRGTGKSKESKLFGSVTSEQAKLTKYGVQEYDANQFATRTGLGVEKSFARGGKGDRKGLEGPKLKRHNDKLEALEAVTTVNAMMADGNFDTGRIKKWANDVKKLIGEDDAKLSAFEAEIDNFIDIEQRLRSGAAAPFQEALKIAGFIGSIQRNEVQLREVLKNTTARTRREFRQLRDGYASAGTRLPPTNFDHYGRLLTDKDSIRHRASDAVRAVGRENWVKVFDGLAAGKKPPPGSALYREIQSAAAELIYQALNGGADQAALYEQLTGGG